MNKKMGLILSLIIVLTGCDQSPQADAQTSSGVEEKVINSGTGEYKTVTPLKDMNVRGVNNSDGSTNLDLDNMEYGLYNLSKEFASPESYYYQPGQILSSEDAQMLLEREYTQEQYEKELEINEDALNIGINPKLEDDVDPVDSKIYANTIIEQDFFKYTDGKEKKIDTVSIGIGFDSTYTYKKDGKDVTVEITNDELNSFAVDQTSSRMTEYIRSKEGYEDVRIVYGFFLQNADTQLPGSYISYGVVEPGKDKIENVKTVNEKYISFPSAEGEKTDSTLDNQIKTLSKKVYEYFQVSSSVSAYGYYKDDKLQYVDITVIADVFSRVDGVSLVSFLEQELNTMLIDTDVNVEIKRPTNEPIGYVSRSKNGTINKYVY